MCARAFFDYLLILNKGGEGATEHIEWIRRPTSAIDDFLVGPKSAQKPRSRWGSLCDGDKVVALEIVEWRPEHSVCVRITPHAPRGEVTTRVFAQIRGVVRATKSWPRALNACRPELFPISHVVGEEVHMRE